MNCAFITDEQRALLLANGQQSIETSDFDPAPVVKLFTPDAGATWLLTEIDPDDHDHAFGLCDLGLGMPELGWVSLQELATVRGRLGLPIERDLHFRAEKRLSAYARDARLAGRVVV
ncbi:transposon [Alicycliphilus sp. B1]|nr:transposon [Alicycliphilus sp. B1]